MCNTKRMMFNSVHNVGMTSEISYLLFISSPGQNRRMAECSLPESQELCLEIAVPARIAESGDRRMFGNKNSFSCQSNLPFCVHKIHQKPYRGLPQASHGTRTFETYLPGCPVTLASGLIFFPAQTNLKLLVGRVQIALTAVSVSSKVVPVMEASLVCKDQSDSPLFVKSNNYSKKIKE